MAGRTRAATAAAAVIALGLASLVTAGGATASPAVPPAVAPAAAPSVASASVGYVPLSPARLLDTRSTGATVDGVGARGGAIAGKTSRTFPVLGRGGVPSSGVDAVVLNVTAVSPTASTFLTVFPAGVPVPNSSNLNVLKGEVSPNLVVVKVGSAGSVSVFVGSGSVNVLADVAGYYPTGGGLTALSPGRLMDTRPTGATIDGQAKGAGPVVGGVTRDLQVTGRYGIPASGVAAVVLNVTGVAPTANTFATVWPTGSARPNTSNLNLLKGEVKPNLVIAKLGTGGKVSFAVGSGSMNMLADVAGWIPDGSTFTPLTPGRLLDTRPTGVTVDGVGAKGGALPPGGVRDVKVTGRYGIPASGVSAVVLNVTGVAPSATTFVTAFPSGETQPNASNLNLVKGEVRPNLVIAKVGSNGSVRLFNKSGTLNLLADVAGWYATTGTAAALAVSTATLPAGVVAKAYPATQLAAAGGTSPYTWSLRSSAAVPRATGLTVSAAGVVGGTPDKDGSLVLPVRVTDSKGATADKDLPVSITFQPVAITTTSLPAASCGTAYSAQLAATGSYFPGNWFLKTGSVLPAGLTLTGNGLISGTPSASTSAPFTIQLVDAKGGVVEKTFTITVSGCAATLAVATTSLTSGTVGAAYSQALSATGGTTPYTWSIVSGALPAGLTLTPSSGAVTGTPSGAPGTASFTVRVTDSATPTRKTADKALSITIAAPPPVTIGTTTLPDGQVGVAYNRTLSASGGSQPYAWSVVTGSLPPGLSLSSGGVLSGTPTTPGTSSFEVKVVGGSTSDQQALTLKVIPAPLVITTSSLPGAALNQPYESALVASGGVTPYTWTTTAGTLPAGITLTAAGVLTGTPTAGGTSTFTVQVKDSATVVATKSLSLTVSVPPVVISPTTFADGTVGVEYSEGVFPSGGSSSTCTVTVSSGTLPSGLTLQHDTQFGGDFWFIGGTPLVAGTSSFTLGATCGTGTGSRAYTLTIKPTPLAMLTTVLPAGLVSQGYDDTLEAQGGTGPYTWSIVSGSLPAGLTLSSAGRITGTLPSTFGEATASIRVTDHVGATVTRSFTIYVNEITVIPVYGNGTVGVPYSSTAPEVDGLGPYTWTSTGTLPAGLSLGGATGVVSGTPSTAGTSTFAVMATDSRGLRGKAPVVVTIHSPGPALSITTATLPNGAVSAFYSSPLLQASGGNPGYTWDVTAGALPPGLFLSGFDCSGPGVVTSCWNIGGSPDEPGTFTFTLTVTDDGQVKASKSFTVTVAPAPLSITTTALPPGSVGSPYTKTLKATGGVTPHTWSLTSGTMPAGLSLSTTGVISGTPTAAASATLGLKVTDSAATTATSTLTLVVAAPAAATSLAAGTSHSCAVVGGKARCWGSNYGGELGIGVPSNDLEPAPREVSGLTGVASVAAGDGFTCAVLTDKRVACWGSNFWGQVGDGSTLQRDVPVFNGITDAVAVTAGEDHACALLSTGAVTCWGNNNNGEVGTGSASTTPVKVPTTVAFVSGATSVSAGLSGTCAVVAGGAVKCWGSNFSGQLGDGTFDDRVTPVTPVASGATTVSTRGGATCARMGTGAVSCWGSIGGATPTQVVTGASSVAVGGTSFACGQTGATVTCWGSSYGGQLGNGSTAFVDTPVTVSGVSGTVAGTLAAGDSHACVVLTGGSARCWGDNSSGQVGTGQLGRAAVPSAVSGIGSGATSVSTHRNHTCAVVGGAARCWGDNTYGQVGTGVTENSYPTSQGVSGLTSGVADVSTGYDFSCARRTAGTVACWGGGFSGQLGDGTFGSSPTPVEVSGLTGVTALSSSDAHSCVVRAGGVVSCWGDDSWGQLGGRDVGFDGVPVDVPGISGATAVATGGQNSCAVVAGTVRCWGDNSSGQLGNGTTDPVDGPVQVAGLTGATSVSVGSGYACAVLTAGGLRCWGANGVGQLGTGDLVDRLAPTAVTGISTASQVSAGVETTCARLTGGSIQCWGVGYDGELGNGLETSSPLPKTVSGISTGTQVSVGATTVCARSSSGALQCWGDGGAGALGDGGSNVYLVPQRVMGT